MNLNQKIIKPKLGLLELAKSLGSISSACKAMGLKWDKKYSVISDIWQRNWSGIIPFFAFPEEIRKVIYTLILWNL